VILLCGLPDEPPLAMAREALDQLGLPSVLLDQRDTSDTALNLEITEAKVGGELRLAGRRYPLDAFTGVYLRLLEPQGPPIDADGRSRSARSLLQTLVAWCEVTAARVVNRTTSAGSNFSKPYQLQLIRAQGFEVPETLVTNDPDLVGEFLRTHGRVVYKSISSTRSIVQALGPEDLERLDRVMWCPTQFQRYVEGLDVRVHVVGTEVYASAIATNVPDYRYAHRQGGDARVYGIDLVDELADRCTRLAAALALPFAGIDLKLTPDGHAVCLEVNPSPAYSYYQAGTGQPISQALARYFAGTAS
jgi:RimK-like ATP-grasp domain